MELYGIHNRLSRRSLQYYLDNVVINSSPEPRAWGTIREPWQDTIIRHKVPLFEFLAGIRDDPGGPLNFCDILPRGHDKSSLEGRLATWLLLYSRRLIKGYILAADKDQGKLLIQAMWEEARLNPWVEEQLTFAGNKVTGPCGFLEVIPADAGSAFGLRGNLYICDELTNWKKPKAKEVWQAVVSGMAKVTPTVVGILSNAGHLGTWQETVWKSLLQDPLWRCYEAPGHMASWMSEEAIASLKAKLASPAEGRRVYDNKWISAAEDADYLTLPEVEACCVDALTYRMTGDTRIKNYVASIDYGPKRDRTCCLVGHRNGGLADIDRMDTWTTPCAPSEVANWIEEINRKFRPAEYVIDPYQMLGTIEQMRRKGLPIHEFEPRGGAGNFEIAQTLRGAVTSGSVRWYPGCGYRLHEELAQLVCVRKGYGYRIDHTSTQHDDQAVAMGMFLVRSQEYPGRRE